MSKRIEYTDACNWNLTVAALKDYDHVYVNGIRYTEYQPDINTQAQPEQEPVAWIIETEIEGKLSEWVCTDKKHYMDAHDGTKDPIPLYTAPQKRKPLSDEEIEKFWEDNFYNGINFYARAIEKAHGICTGG
jgi:hypothetical protein